MGFLAGKKALVVGVASERSIASGVAKCLHREGAELAFTFQGDKLKPRVEKLAGSLGSSIVLPCDVTSDDEIKAVIDSIGSQWDGIDVLIHSVGYAPADQLRGDYIDDVTREGFKIAHDISSYSFAALAKAALPLMENRNASLLTLTYLGAERAFPNYNVMGLAKASLEANVRYLAYSLGKRNIRVNGISAGPIKTLAAAGIGSFRKMLSYNEKVTPLHRNVSLDDVGNASAFLTSDLANGITGEILHVDAGFHMVGMAEDEV